MTILAECPNCHKKQSIRNKLCNCGINLDRAKRDLNVKYWISYRTSNGKQKRELVGDLEKARLAHAQCTLHKNKSLKNEKWSQVKMFDILFPYDISNFGRVRNRKNHRLLTYKFNLSGYPLVNLCRYNFAVHRLVALTFIGPCPEGCEVNHKDCNKENNHVSNLEWVTHHENMTHAVKMGRFKKDIC